MASVDVIIPNYQYGHYLRQCVESVLGQGVERLRILIIDNASTDDSVEVAKALSAFDSRIQVQVHPVNLGFHASVNEGLDWAESDYVLVLCSDDLLPPGTLKRALNVLEDNPAVAFAYGRYIQLHGSAVADMPANTADAMWQIQSGSAFIAQSCGGLVRTMAPLVRTAMQKKAGHYRPELRITSDLEILLRLACHGDVAATPAIQGIQRIHQTNISVASWQTPLVGVAADQDTFDAFFRNEGRALPDGSRLHRLARRNLAKRTYWRAVGFMLRGQRRNALDLLKLSVRLDPSIAIIPPVDQLWRLEKPVSRAARIMSQNLMSVFRSRPVLKQR